MTAAPASVPLCPRESWAEHRNFPDHVLLLGSHENFRRISAHLVEHVEHDPGWAESLYRRWKAAMGSHEAYEERKLYPFLASRWDVSCEKAERGHHVLHEHDAKVRAAFHKARGDRSEANLAAIKEALRGHDEALREHLVLEEDLVIPLLLELSREEFEAYLDS